jgi:hypothetical protein
MVIFNPVNYQQNSEIWLIQPTMLLIFLMPFTLLTWLTTTIKFRKAMRKKTHQEFLEVPVLPYWIPWVRHYFSLRRPVNFLSKLG